MHKQKREPAAPRKVDDKLHIVPISIGPKKFAKYLSQNKISHVVAFEKFERGALQDVSEKKLYLGQFPMVVGSVPVEVPDLHGIGIHGVRLIPQESFSSAGRRNLLKGAMKAYDLVGQGHNVAFSCTYGTRRSSRGHYIFRRLVGDSHKDAMTRSNAPDEDEHKLKETWENRQKYFDS